MQASRRDFLKGILGAAGTTVAGHFIISDPRVPGDMAAPLIAEPASLVLPEPLPLVAAREMPKKAEAVARGFMRELAVHHDVSPRCYSWSDRPAYVEIGGHAEMVVDLDVDSLSSAVAAVGGPVEVYIVRRRA